MRNRFERLEREFDVVVIGGGINGAGVARDAARRGFRVVLLEKNDFGSGSSSRTSKLAHGGLRYLEQGALRLVWEACHERQTLLRLAPHLVRPLPFVFPVYEDSRLDALRLRIGMWLYDVLATFRNVRRHHMLRLASDNRWSRGLRTDGLRAAALYYDAIMDDARLVVANVISAREAGARTMNGAAVRGLLVHEGSLRGVEVVDGLTGDTCELRARCAVSCTGAWTNALLARLPGVPRAVEPTRGTHLLVRPITQQAFTLSADRDGRIFFVLPWLGLTLIGTTDVEHGDDPDQVAPSDDEVEYLLAEANHFFPGARLQRRDVIAAFAGLRPLLRADGHESSRSREHRILQPVPRLLSVVGGKYTTYRAVAEEVVDRIEALLGRRGRCSTAADPLPGGHLRWSPREHWEEGEALRNAAAEGARVSGLSLEVVSRLYRTHGSRAPQILALAKEDATLAAPLCAHQPHTRAEVRFAVREDMALHLEDWFLRRSRMGYRACHGIDALDSVADLFAAELGWSGDQRAREIDSCHERLDELALNRPPASSRSS
ncbi:MAG: glycerol-3-phosphate dehydrogenase [Candidatus Krumholzibacteriia bacterium]